MNEGRWAIGRAKLIAVLAAILVSLVAAAILEREASADVIAGYYSSTVTVNGNTSTNVDTGINLRTGDRVVITASGEINPGCLFCTGVKPDGGNGKAPGDWPAPGEPEYSLIGFCSGDNYFLVGSSRDWIHQGGPCRLYLYINDIWTSDNSGSFKANIRVDRDVPLPETSITSGPSGLTTSNSTSVGFSGFSPDGGVRFECSLDDGSYAPCSSPKQLTGLANGSHTFRVRAVDRFNRPDPTPATRSWTVDTIAPDTAITSGPSGVANASSARFEFLSSEPGVRFECKLDAASFDSCSSPKEYLGLSNGSHTFQVRAIDAAGNVDLTPAERSWTVGNMPPTISSLKPAPGSATHDRTPHISAVVRDAETELTQSNITLKVDGSVKSFAYDGVRDRLVRQSNKLAYGKHTVSVKATDGQETTTRIWSFKVVR